MNKVTSTDDYRLDVGYEPHTNRLLEPVIFRYIDQFQPKSLLDIGCGNGTMDRDLAERCPNLVGMDPGEGNVEAARKNCPQGKFYCLGIYDPVEAVAESDFDMVVSTEVIEHVFYPRELPRFAHKKLKPGGILIISTPYHGYLKNLLIALLGKWDKHHTSLWDGGHIKFWSRNTLTTVMEEAGFEIIGFHGCGRGPWLWESMCLVGRKKD